MPENCIYIARSSAIAARALAGEMMVMNSADSTFFTLNEVATAIFQAADGHTPLRDIVRDRVCEQFDVDPEQAQKEPNKIFNLPVELVTGVAAKDREGHDVVTFSYRPSKN